MWGARMAGCSPTRPPPAASTGAGVGVTGAASLRKACPFPYRRTRRPPHTQAKSLATLTIHACVYQSPNTIPYTLSDFMPANGGEVAAGVLVRSGSATRGLCPGASSLALTLGSPRRTYRPARGRPRGRGYADLSGGHFRLSTLRNGCGSLSISKRCWSR